MVNKNTVDYYPNPYHLVSRRHTLIFLYIPEGFISAEYFLGFFPKPAYSTLVAKKFQIYSTKITANIFVKKLNLFIFTHDLKQNYLSGFYHYPPSRWEAPIPHK